MVWKGDGGKCGDGSGEEQEGRTRKPWRGMLMKKRKEGDCENGGIFTSCLIFIISCQY